MMEPDAAEQAWDERVERRLSPFPTDFDSFISGYRAGLAASPSEELERALDLLEAESGHHIEITGMDDHSYDVEVHRLDEDGEPKQIWKASGPDRLTALTRLLAALRTTKEGNKDA